MFSLLSCYDLLATFKTNTDVTQFGASHTPSVGPPDDSDSEDEQDIEEAQAMPRVEEWRMNLTVLSQYYNVRQMPIHAQ